MISANIFTLSNGFSARIRPFSREEIQDPLWNECFPKGPEGYPYHLAFAEAGVENFDTAMLLLEHEGQAQAAIPFFATEYRLDATIQGSLKHCTDTIGRHFPRLLRVRLLCVGSPVTDHLHPGIPPTNRTNARLLHAINEALEALAASKRIGLIAFKDVLQRDREWLDPPLTKGGYTAVANMPVARNPIRFDSIDDYLGGFSRSSRKDIRRKLRARERISIQEIDTTPEEIEALYRLYLNCYEKSDLKFERLTPAFFRNVAEFAEGQCRFVLYREEERLIGFNMLIHRDGMLVDKYLGMDYDAAIDANLYFLSWMHNIEMCIRDGFHTFQSGQGAYATKKRLGAELEMTWIYFRHRNPLLNRFFRGMSRILAYTNFDQAVSDA